MSFIPNGSYFLIRPENKETTKSGLVLADSGNRQVKWGKVVTAPKVSSSPILEGTSTLYSGFTAIPVSVDGEELVLVKEEDILGYIK